MCGGGSTVREEDGTINIQATEAPRAVGGEVERAVARGMWKEFVRLAIDLRW